MDFDNDPHHGDVRSTITFPIVVKTAGLGSALRQQDAAVTTGHMWLHSM